MFVFLLSCVAALFAQGAVEAPAPTAFVVNNKGDIEDLEPGDDYRGEAPVTVRFDANAPQIGGYSLTCSWEFFKEGDSEPYLVRYDAEVELKLSESGTTVVYPNIVYTSLANSEVYYPFDSEHYSPFRIVLAESSIKVPNAFSPNGDTINDLYNVYDVKSIVEFNAAIYNRWGQELYRWGIDEIGEGGGWDGTYKGKPVKAGVYYVVVKAKGADGVEYEFYRDVNLLRGYTEETAAP